MEKTDTTKTYIAEGSETGKTNAMTAKYKKIKR